MGPRTRFILRTDNDSIVIDSIIDDDNACRLPPGWMEHTAVARPAMLSIVQGTDLETALGSTSDVVLWAALWWSWMRRQITPPHAEHQRQLVVWGTCTVGCSSRGFEQIEHVDDATLAPLIAHLPPHFAGVVLILHARGRGPKTPDRKAAAAQLPQATFTVRAVDDILDIADAVRQAIVSVAPHLERPLNNALDLPLTPGRLQPDRELLGWLTRASQLAEHNQQGFLGFEHLALAAIELTQAGHSSMATLAPSEQALRYELSQLSGKSTTPTRATRRVRRWFSSLDGVCSAADLYRIIANDHTHHLHELCGRDLASTLDKPPAVAPTPSSARWSLEVVGGPQDGLLLPMIEGMVVGRGRQSTVCMHALYHLGPLSDPYLSRRALTWIDDGNAEVAGDIQRLRHGYRDTRFGRITVLPGDLIYLTEATRLRAVGSAPPPGRWGD